MGKDTIYRLAIKNSANDTVSPLWTITLSGADVYIFCRALGHRVKGTIHSDTGQCHIKFDKEFAERNASVLSEWLIDQWFYDKVGSWIEPFRIVFPYSTIDIPRTVIPTRKNVNLFPIEEDCDAAFARFVVVAPTTEIVNEPQLLHLLPDGSRFCLSITHRKMPIVRVPNPAPVRFFSGVSPDDIDEGSKLRGVLLGNDGETRCLFNIPINLGPKQ